VYEFYLNVILARKLLPAVVSRESLLPSDPMNNHVILCPIDYSLHSDVVIEIALRLADPKKSKIILLSVTDPSKSESNSTSMADDFAKKTRTRLQDQSFHEGNFDVEHLNLHGNPADVIVLTARAKKADLIIMGTHGRSGWSKLIMGSVAQEVMKEAHCPVISVRLPHDSESR
jgi:universal stress protein A